MADRITNFCPSSRMSPSTPPTSPSRRHRHRGVRDEINWSTDASHMNAIGSFFQDKVALVTGASSGIGEELAWQLAQAGAMVTLAARRKPLLEKLAERII